MLQRFGNGALELESYGTMPLVCEGGQKIMCLFVEITHPVQSGTQWTLVYLCDIAGHVQ